MLPSSNRAPPSASFARMDDRSPSPKPETARRADADDGAVPRDQGGQSRTACCSTGWAISTRCSSTTPRSRSRALGIALTKRGKHDGADIPMCGVPVHAADGYLQKLIARGFRVAVCEQIEDPAEARKRGGKAVVRRDVIRLVTPGTLTEDALLDAGRNNYLAAVARQRGGGDGGDPFALAWIDISTGEFRLADERRRPARRRPRPHRPARVDPRRAAVRRRRPRAVLARPRPRVTPLAPAFFDGATAGDRLAGLFRRQDARRLRQLLAPSSPPPPRRSPMSRRRRSASGRRCRRRRPRPRAASC